MEREKVVTVISSKARDLTRDSTFKLRFVFAREILHFVQDDRRYGGVLHGVVLKWNEKK